MAKRRETELPVSDRKRYVGCIRGMIGAAMFAAGGYYEIVCAALSVALLIWLAAYSRRQRLTVMRNCATAAVLCIFAFAALSVLWGVDSGLAAWGIAKYLPLPLLGLCLTQLTADERRQCLGDLPWLGAGMTLLSFALQYAPLVGAYFTVSGRLAGFFQYPNTFACLLLLGWEVLLLAPAGVRPLWQTLPCGVLLAFGVLQSGSRAVFLLSVAATVVCAVLQICRGAWKAAAVRVGVVAAGGGVLSLLAGAVLRSAGAAHLGEISAEASTLLGRLLYWKDALPVIVRHPFGLGYLGYYMTQTEFQTGVYSVRWVHNDLLQLLLDVGWIGAILAVAAAGQAVLSKRSEPLRRVLLLTLLAHCVTDFDLEFAAMFCVVLLCLDWEAGKRLLLRRAALPLGVGALLAAFSLYVGIASTLTYMGSHGAAVRWYPWNTLSDTELLTADTDAALMAARADRILRRNEHVALAWDARARAAFSRGDFSTLIAAKRQAIRLNPYALEEYTDYFDMLTVGAAMYDRAGDSSSAAICRQEIAAIQGWIDETLAKTDPLAWRIADKPELTMPEAYTDYLRAMQ